MKKNVLLLLFLMQAIASFAEDGYRLWLRYDRIANEALLARYRNGISSFYVESNSPTLSVARQELETGLQGLLGKKIEHEKLDRNSIVVSLRSKNSTTNKGVTYAALGKEGFAISSSDVAKNITITANTDVGCLYGVFHFLRLLQTHQSIQNLNIISIPKIENRILNHWDNLNGSVERGYAGGTIWNWHQLPRYIDQRYIDYARANASLGINGTVLTNVNANAQMLTPLYLEKVKALANAFRPYGLKVYLTARFSAPIEIGGLKTADPLDAAVQKWWSEKATEIYKYIPDFGGFLVKANSEGQPGPQNYGRSHADGANMLADAVAPHGGIVMWRAFVYDVRVQQSGENFESGTTDKSRGSIASADRSKQAYNEFQPLDGQFRKNVMIQVKNGPIDFQPREPFSPLFGAMPKTPLVMEFQITHEYLGQGTHLVYDAPLFKEVLDADTYQNGQGTTVASVIDGSAEGHKLTAIAGVANIGADRNWTSHPFLQSNWYAFGRLAWDHTLSSTQIADEWLRQTFTNNSRFVQTAKAMMIASREAVVNYMTPLGLHHIMATSHHYGPGPWVSNLGRADWNPVYYHKADSFGIGFNRTATGSNALAQYAEAIQKQWKDSNTCDEQYLLWFHHVSWNHKMQSGKTLWNELCARYQQGVDTVRWMQQQWNGMEQMVGKERFKQVQMFLNIQEAEAVWWRDACLLYFQTFSRQPLPAGYESPKHDLEYYKSLRFPFAPGI